jgi:hypothetical protein
MARIFVCVSSSVWPFVWGSELAALHRLGARAADGTAWGMFLHSSAGMDVVATEDVLSWRAIGGMVDLFVMVGPTPLDVMQQLTRVVGRPALPPYWALGYHQAGYAAWVDWLWLWLCVCVQRVASQAAKGAPMLRQGARIAAYHVSCSVCMTFQTGRPASLCLQVLLELGGGAGGGGRVRRRGSAAGGAVAGCRLQ